MASNSCLKHYIGGTWREGTGVRVFDVVNPATEERIDAFTAASADDLAEAVDSAQAGFRQWRAQSADARYAILVRAAALIRERVEATAHILSAEGGKSVAEARREILRGADLVEWDAAEGRKLYGRTMGGELGFQTQVLREPVGVALALVAWNFTAAFISRKVGGALAAGCSVILKATEETPGTCVALIECFVDAGVPVGAVTLVHGEAPFITKTLIAAAAVRIVSFTGSTAIGRVIAELCAHHLKRCILELGGHSPVLVCEDASLDDAVKATLQSKFLNNAGQVCVAPTRFFIAAKRYDAFVERFAAAAAAIEVGGPVTAPVTMGPLIHGRRVTAIHELVTEAIGHGATLRAGGARLDRPGYFYAPTILENLSGRERIMQEEPFGPVALMKPVQSFEEGIALANATSYGLAAYAFTESLRTARQLAEQIDSGYLAINHGSATPLGAPFGGTKNSGYGREGGPEGLLEFTQTKVVSTRYY